MNTAIFTHTVALDLGELKHAVCVLNANGEIIDERSIPNHWLDLEALSEPYPNARIVFEVDSYQYLRSHVAR